LDQGEFILWIEFPQGDKIGKEETLTGKENPFQKKEKALTDLKKKLYEEVVGQEWFKEKRKISAATLLGFCLM